MTTPRRPGALEGRPYIGLVFDVRSLQAKMLAAVPPNATSVECAVVAHVVGELDRVRDELTELARTVSQAEQLRAIMAGELAAPQGLSAGWPPKD